MSSKRKPAKKSKRRTNSKRRSKILYPALHKHTNARIRQEQMDWDYLHKLSQKELEWLNNFTVETLNAAPGKKHYKTKKSKKKIYDENNARNRDIYSRQKTIGSLGAIDNYKIAKIEENVDVGYNYTEDNMIDYLDEKLNGIKRYIDDSDNES